MKRDPSPPEPRNGGRGGGVLPAPGPGSRPPAERSLLCLMGSHGFFRDARRRALDKGFSLRKIAAVTLNLSLLLTPPPPGSERISKSNATVEKGNPPKVEAGRVPLGRFLDLPASASALAKWDEWARSPRRPLREPDDRPTGESLRLSELWGHPRRSAHSDPGLSREDVG